MPSAPDFSRLIEIEKDARGGCVSALLRQPSVHLGLDLNQGGRSWISACFNFSRLDASIRMQRDGGDALIGSVCCNTRAGARICKRKIDRNRMKAA